MTRQQDTRRTWLICLILLLGTFLVFCPALRCGFVSFDDPQYVTANLRVRRGFCLDSIRWALTNATGNWHPLTWLSHMLDRELFGLNPAGHHLTNVLFHGANALLLFAVFRRMTGAFWRSALVAALFAWHPLHVESVAWVAERKDVLSACFWLLTMLAYVRYTEWPGPSRYLLAFLLFALGLMAKPMVVTLPFALLLLDFWPLGRSAHGGVGEEGKSGRPVPWGRLVLEKVPFFILAAISSVVTFFAQRKAEAVVPLGALTVEQRGVNALIAYVRYLGKTIWPADLAVFYPHSARPAWQAAGAALLLAGILGVALLTLRRRPYLFVGWSWFLGTLVPVIGLIQVGGQSMADRYTYLPLIGIFVVVVWGLWELVTAYRIPRPILGAASVAVLSACLVLTWLRVQTWTDSITLFRHDLAVAGKSVAALNNLGRALMDAGKPDEALAYFEMALQFQPPSPITLYDVGMIFEERGDYPRASEFFHEALRLRPGYAEVQYSLGNVLAFQGKFQEAADQYVEALRADPDMADAYYNLGVVLGKLNQPREAVEQLKAALRLVPDHAPARAELAGAYVKLGYRDAALAQYREAIRLKPDFVRARVRLGLLLAQQAQLEEAKQHFSKAIQLEPTNDVAYYNLAAVFAAQGQLDAAADAFATVVRLKPTDADACARLGAVLARLGKFEAAITQYRAALRSQPDMVEALRGLATILATNPNAELRSGAEAVLLAERANELAGRRDPAVLTALDEAYAEVGRFEDAIQTAHQVQELAAAMKQPALAEQAARRLELYRAGQPYRE